MKEILAQAQGRLRIQWTVLPWNDARQLECDPPDAQRSRLRPGVLRVLEQVG